MDVPTLLNSLKEEVTCSVCIHLYTNPKQLPCLHIFCLECLNNLARTSTRKGKIKCPICETEVAVPETGTMETLPSCFYVKNLLDVLSIKECNTSKVTCGNCDEKREEASYCFHCGKFWCKDCLNAHNILKEHREHRVLSLQDFQDEDFENVLKRPAFCQNELHEKEVLKFYCKVCEVPVCQNCVIVEHNKHDVEYLEVCARSVSNSIASRLETVKKSSEAFSNSLRKLDETNRILSHRSQVMTGQIKAATKSLISTIQQQEQELTTEVENETKTLVEENLKSIAKFHDQLKKNEEIMKQAERFLELSTGAELVRAKTEIDKLFQGLQVQDQQGLPPSSDWNGNIVGKFVKNEDLSKCLQELKIGHLVTERTRTKASQCSIEGFREVTAGVETTFEVITRNPQGEQCYSEGDYIDVNITSAEGENVAAEIKIADNNNGRYEISMNPSQAGRHKLTIQVNGENIKEFPPTYIKERTFTPLRIIREGLKQPWGVVVNDSNEIFVSDLSNNRIVSVNEKGDFVRCFGDGLLNEPTGMCIDKEGRIFVANRGNNKILLFDPQGKYVKEICTDKPLQQPRGIALDAHDNLVVCDTGNKCVKFISPEGRIFMTLEMGNLEKPFHCLCYEDKVFVSDHSACLIKVYNSFGKFLYEFCRNTTVDGDSTRLGGLALDKTGHLLVCNESGHNVQVFTREGKFVGKFGVPGTKHGCFSRPTSVSVLKSGHIIVCEFGNNRLQIFE